MDVNETLETIRRLAANFRDTNWPWDDTETDLLIEHIEALDEWISNGGFLPLQWRQEN